MKKRIENYIPDAINIISEVGIADNNDKVDSKFNGYFSAFGAAVVLSGLKPALAFYSNKPEELRAKILVAIYKLVVDRNAKNVQPKDLLTYYIQNESNKMLKYEILDAAVALKLAVRTYKFQKS